VSRLLVGTRVREACSRAPVRTTRKHGPSTWAVITGKGKGQVLI